MDKITFLFSNASIKIDVLIGSGLKDDWAAINTAREKLEANGLKMGAFCGKVEWERQIISGDYSWFIEKGEEKEK